MNGDIGLSSIWIALAGGVVPALIAAFKQRPMTRWYLYGFACTLVAWPLLALPTIHALLVLRHDTPKTLPATAAEGRRTGSDRGEQRAVVPELDSRPKAQIARWHQPTLLCL
jgi:hypothetical protein